MREACARHGALLIFDEIPSCLARTGHMFACEGAGATPDILVIGKGLGGGVMPMAADIADPALDVAAGASLGHYTHEKSPLGCGGGARDARRHRRGKADRARPRLERTRSCASSRHRSGRHGGVRDARALGCYFGVELASAGSRAERAMYACLRAASVSRSAAATVLTLCPPLTIAEAEFDRAFDILDEALAETGAG